MRTTKRFYRPVILAATVVVAGAASLAGAGTGAAAPAVGAGDLGAQGCTTLQGKTVINRTLPTTIELWRCDSGWSAVIDLPKIGDQVYLRSGAGTITGLRNVQYDLTTTVTKTVGIKGAPWAACGKAPNHAEVCTDHLW